MRLTLPVPFSNPSFISRLKLYSSHDAWEVAFPQEFVGTDGVKTASRLLPRSVFQSDDLRNQTWTAYRDAVSQVCLGICISKYIDALSALSPWTFSDIL